MIEISRRNQVMEPVAQVALEGGFPSYTTDNSEICESKAQN